MNQDNQGPGGYQPDPGMGQPQNNQGVPPHPPGTMQQDAIMVFLSYFGIFALIPFLTVKDNDYIRWHSKQGLTFCVAFCVIMFAGSLFSAIMQFIPVLGGILGLLMGLLMAVASLAFFAGWILALVKAFNGQRWKLPMIGDLSERW